MRLSGPCDAQCPLPIAAYWNLIRNPLTVQVSLGEDLATSLADGVVLCHIANHVSPRAVSSIHVPSPAVVSSLTLTPHRL